MSTEYRIDCLSDFLKVPAGKQAECLSDFSTWLNVCRRGDDLNSEIEAESPGLNAKLNLDGFVWVDDGERGISDVSFSVNGEEIGRAGVIR
jgi:hypothetical protein